MASPSFPLIHLEGDHHEIGVQFGQAAAGGIKRFLSMILEGARLARSWDQAETLRRSLAFVPLFKRHCPHLLLEIEGLAEGARISFAEALLLQLRAEVTQVVEGCSAFAFSGTVTADGRVLAGQNSDMSPEMEELGLVVKIKPPAGPRIIMFTFPGLLGYHGLNSVGVAHFANALPTRPWKMALPHYPLKRMFLESSSVQACLRLMEEAPVCSTGNYVLADGQGNIADAELTPTGYQRWHGEDGWIVHTNHYLAATQAAEADNVLAGYDDSVHRYERFCQLVRERSGALDVPILQQILSDHAGYPTSLCRHMQDRPSKTIASLIAEPERGLLHIAVGNPCQNGYVTYEV